MDCSNVKNVHASTYDNAGTLINGNINIPTQENLLKILQRAIEETTEEHLATNKKITELLHMFQLEPKSLSNHLKEQFDKVSMILKSEGLPDINTRSLDIVKRRKNMQEMERDIFEGEIKMKLHHLDVKVKSLEKKINLLKQLIENGDGILDNAKKDMKDMSSKNTYMVIKLKEYNEASEKMESDLQIMQLIDINSEIILDKYKQYIEMIEQEIKLDQFLDQCNGLPLDLLQARKLLDDKQKEYEQLENTFFNYMGI